LALPSLALAAGLGKLSVLSTLGQPLKAEIEIVSLQRGEGDSLGARLAPSDVFRQAAVDMNPALLQVKFAVEKRPNGGYVMTLNSPQPMNEPFVDVLVELNWSNGRLVREYTFLLDPPEYAARRKGEAKTTEAPAPTSAPEPVAQQAPASDTPVQAQPAEPAPMIAAVPLGPNVPGGSSSASEPAPAPAAALVPTPAPAEPEPAGEPKVEAAAVAPRSEPEPVQVAAAPTPGAPTSELVQEPPSAGNTYQVVRGDTLSKIAMRNQVEGVSLQQMLVALFRANPDAFVADNMNRLSAGKIINIPDRDAAESVASADARRIVSAQYADFNDYRRSLGIAVASSSAAQGTRQASGPITPPKEEKPAAPKEQPKDELRLSRGDDAKKGGKAGSTAAADDLAAKDNALKEANERIALLQKNVQDLQNLVELKNKAAAQAQQQAEAAKAEAAKAAAVAKAQEPAKIAPKAPEPTKAPEPAAKAAPAPAAKAPEAPKAPEPAKAPEPPKPAQVAQAPAPPAAAKAPEAPQAPEAAKAPEAPKPPADAAKAAPAPKAAPKKAAQQQPTVEVSFIDELLDNPTALGTGGFAFLALIGYAVFKWRRKRSSQFENSIMSVVPSDADSVLGSVGGRNVDTSSSSIQSDFGAGTSKAAGEEIDPIAEADVYMAYGRDAQAEEILKDALSKDSSRQAIRVKLLEIYANRKDTRSFEAAANDLRTATGGRGAEWEKVVSLGLSIDPSNPLYGGKPAAAAAPVSQLPAGFNETAQMPAFNPPTTSAPPIAADAPLNIDFDIGGSTQAGAPLPDLDLGVASAPSQGGGGGLDFDLGLGGGDKAAASAAPAPAAEPAPEPALSIDFNLPSAAEPAPAPAPAPAAAPALELGAIDFDIGGTTPSAAAEEPKAAAVDLGGISLDLGAPGPGNGNGSGGAPDARWQEVATKLDLAKAYEEMGDKDGARELLKEVVKEGDTAQQQQAQTMLQALG
jgi:pilus assembly protein FimV